jgi:tetratricopeptide (TPR) repeat protein
MTGDNEGNLYVCDYFNGRIQKFDKNGNFIACIGEGVLGLPRFVALDINGNVYVTDDLKNKIFVFSPAVFVKGIEFFEKKDYEKAAFYFEKEIKRDDKNLNARYYLAYCYFKLKKYDEVVRIKNETDKLGLKGYPKELIDVLYNKVIKWYEEK